MVSKSEGGPCWHTPDASKCQAIQGYSSLTPCSAVSDIYRAVDGIYDDVQHKSICKTVMVRSLASDVYAVHTKVASKRCLEA